MGGFFRLIILGLFLVILFEGGSILRSIQVSKELTRATRGYANNDKNPLGRSMLVLGDSTALGVGASRPEESVAGRLADTRAITYTENYAKAGATAADIKEQMTRAERSHYDYILVQVGANDIIRFHSAMQAKAELEPVFKAILSSSDRAYFMFAGDMGAVPLFWWPLSSVYHQATLRYRDELHALAESVGITYVDLYDPPGYSVFSKEPDVYFAKDHFHPSSAGYAVWFEKLMGSL